MPVNFHAPEIDYAALSPVIALTAGLCVVLLAGVFDTVKRAVPALTMLALAATAGLLIWQWGDSTDLVAGSLRIDDLAISISLIAVITAAFTVLLSIREPAVEQAGSGEYHALLLGSVLGMVAARPGPEPGQLLRRDRDPLDPALHPLRDRPAPRALARVRAQVPDRRLARLGDAALRDGAALRRLGLDRLRRDRDGDRRTAACSATRWS